MHESACSILIRTLIRFVLHLLQAMRTFRADWVKTSPELIMNGHSDTCSVLDLAQISSKSFAIASKAISGHPATEYDDKDG